MGKNPYTLERSTVPNKTVIRGDRSDEMMLSLTTEQANYLSEAVKTKNKKLSQGIIAYEIFMSHYEGYEDEIDEFEKQVDAQLRDVNVEPDLVNSVRWADLMDVTGLEEQNKQRRLWLPVGFKRHLDSQESSNTDLFIESLNKYIKTPYRDRLHRIKVKQDIYKHIKYDKKLSGLTKDILNNDDALDVDNQLINLAIDITDLESYEKQAASLNTWEKRIEHLDSVEHGLTDIDDYVDYLRDLYEIKSRSHVVSKVRQYADLSQFRSDIDKIQKINLDKELSKRNRAVGLGYIHFLCDEHTIDEIIYSCVRDDNFGREDSIKESDIENIYNVFSQTDVIDMDYDDFFLKYIKSEEMYDLSKNPNSEKVIRYNPDVKSTQYSM